MYEFVADFNLKKREKEDLYFFVCNKEPVDFLFHNEEVEPIQFNIDSNFIFDISN